MMRGALPVARSRGVMHGWTRCAARPPATAAVVVAVTIAAGAGCVPISHYREPYAAVARPAGPAGPDAAATAAALVGDWTGQYDAPMYARRGAMRVSLRRVARTVDGAGISTVAGTATFAAGAAADDSAVVDSARVTPGRVVLWFRPMAEQASGATLQVRLDGALAGDTLGGRLPRPRRLQGALRPPVVAVWESQGVRGRTIDVLDRLERPDPRDPVPHAP